MERIIYMILLFMIFLGELIIFNLQDLWFLGAIVYVGIMLGMYLSDSLRFDLPRYSRRNYLFLNILDVFFFGVWYLITWELSILPFYMIFLGAQILLRTVINTMTYREKNVTILGEGILKNNLEKSIQVMEEYKYVEFNGQLNQLKDFVKVEDIKVILLGKLKLTSDEIETILQLKLSGLEVRGYLAHMLDFEKKVDVEYIDEEWLLNAYGFEILRSMMQNKVKRIFDFTLATVLGIMTAPLMIISAIIVKVESPGGVIYSQARVGENGKEFMVHKFRSMRADAEKNGAQWAQVNDPRVTKFGNFMRKTRIDELPQLLNVIKGEMSFIGPRPERKVFIEELEKQIPYYGLRHMVKPGLTGWAQVMYPYGATVEDAKNKLEYDLYYIKAHSLYLDIIILFKTLKTVVFGRGR
ncbi:exopolysaccharide biosynthesis polyprenyl glycosylphosphotransferase [Cetobacterium sp. SF1]|uniref:exopolysaccharide biosynthesis polyprenyl glycosylphosphotransferase n=1 Tax=Cetobacterium sp. SF1 TaxID=3417654 RepID=UPI003CF8429C